MARPDAGDRPGSRDAGLKTRLVAGAGGGLLSALLETCRVSHRGVENLERLEREGRAAVLVLWHGRLLPCTYWNRHRRLVTVVSQHRDGEYISRVVQKWGYTTVRGSSSRRAAGALRELVRYLRAGRSVAITPDGPRGPRQVMKPGALLAAQLTGAPIIPGAGGASRAWWFGSWDRFLVPKPFSRVRIAYGEPIWVPRDADDADLEQISREVEARLNELTALVDDEEGWERG
ncbi:MAG TPA: lysophospholipid acyltransferase family protein [Longimicrobiaceae bacterium]|nr:lysophospholipid acyltransferase family protein [Longimicrobiaceae bacterium]